MALKLNESKSDDTKQYFKTSVRMLGELSVKIINCAEQGDIANDKYVKDARLLINDLQKALNNISVK